MLDDYEDPGYGRRPPTPSHPLSWFCKLVVILNIAGWSFIGGLFAGCGVGEKRGYNTGWSERGRWEDDPTVRKYPMLVPKPLDLTKEGE